MSGQGVTPRMNHPAATAIAAATDIYTARTVLEALRKAGWIVVREDAIRLAQAHARDEEKVAGQNA